MNLEFVESVFNDYVKKFGLSIYDINYKYNHSYRVMEISNCIASNLNLSDEDILLANIIGLLHDIGRFKQLEMYESFSDLNIDHADLGVKVLFEDNIIEKFNIDKKYHEIIKFAIKNHNKLDIENEFDERKLLHAKIIRDADKIDILKAFTVFNDYEIRQSSDEITEEVKMSFYNQEPINKRDIKNLNDTVILRLCFAFDMNYKISLNIIKQERIYNELYKLIINKKIFKPYFEYLLGYLDEMTKEEKGKVLEKGRMITNVR